MTDQRVSVSMSSSVGHLRAALKKVLKYEPNLVGTSSITFPRSSNSAMNNVNALIVRLELEEVLECTQVELTGRSDTDEVFIDFRKVPEASNERFFTAMEAIQNALD